MHQLIGLIEKTLNSNTDIKDLTDYRIHPQHIATIEDQTFPCITLQVMNPSPAGGKLSKISVMDIEIRTHAETLKQSSQIYNYCKTSLSAQRLTDDNFILVTGELADIPFNITDPDTEPITYNCWTNFSVYARRKD